MQVMTPSEIRAAIQECEALLAQLKAKLRECDPCYSYLIEESIMAKEKFDGMLREMLRVSIP
jgi:hypothetical protein